MQVRSAGLLPYRQRSRLEVLIAHPGGPFWAKRNEGAWSLIKGLIEDDEEAETAAGREFEEETGWPPPARPWLPLGEARLRSGKTVVAWAAAADYDPDTLRPGEFTTTLRGRPATFPEIDRVAWVDLDSAAPLLNPAYAVFLERLERELCGNG